MLNFYVPFLPPSIAIVQSVVEGGLTLDSTKKKSGLFSSRHFICKQHYPGTHTLWPKNMTYDKATQNSIFSRKKELRVFQRSWLNMSLFQKNPAPMEIKSALPPKPKTQNAPRPKTRNFMDMVVFLQKESKKSRRPLNWRTRFRPQNCGQKFYGHKDFSDCFQATFKWGNHSTVGCS